ncbi:hypothetical protein ACSN7N_001173 [Enterobacter hormaechei]|uniref:hypothetical protein n=1 Tax=Enterobacter cloacae complex TaxID=354276 RepID=UPI001CD9B7CA|nr:hypothetical protein [Enterobacter hormaechei]MCA2128555.1 hypothetical protein [Enterobacter hormaechei]MCE1501032.1 hypothetical protein [Enterobacter hormaechei]WGB59034.1 hypothetical protein NFL40_10135 [Enterobacter hormaechei]
MSLNIMWPIPKVPEKSTIANLSYKRWGIVLISMLIVCALLGFSLWGVDEYKKIEFFLLLPAFFIWLCLFGAALNRYEQSSIALSAWKEETERTKALWQHWSRQQLSVVGNVILTPEDKGAESLLGPLSDIPAYPDKVRPLSHSWGSIRVLSDMIDKQLEQQYPGYRKYLHTVYVLQPSSWDKNNVSQIILSQWDLLPEVNYSVECIEKFHDNVNFDGLILVLSFQCWLTGIPKQSSEMVSAQLISSSTFSKRHAIPVLAGLGRVMHLDNDNLEKALEMLFEYNRIDKSEVRHVWLSGITADITSKLMQYAERFQWKLPEKHPFYLIDFSFGPPGEMTFPVSLALLVDAAQNTEANQLLIIQASPQSRLLCLITRKHYL